jgi:hypothetical protein
MCTTLVANLIIEVMDEKLQNGEVFTAYDITMAARAATSDTFSHGDVRNIVNNAFITGDMADKGPDEYERELCTLNLSDSPQAFVYFPDTKSANDHSLVDGHTPVASSVSIPASTASVVDLDDDEYATRKDGRIQIPAKLFAQVTPNAGTYDVLVNGTLKCASKNAKGEIRVGLRQFGIRDSKVKITVDTSNNTINITTV